MSVPELIEDLREAMRELDLLYVERDRLVRTMNEKMIQENVLLGRIRRINLDIVKEG